MNVATMLTLSVGQHATLDAIRGDLIDVYAEVRAPLLHLPNYAVTA